jgi:hypothetical protein
MSLPDLNLPENTPWYAAFLAAVAGATVTLLRPFFRWAERAHEKRSDRLHELRKERIDAERRRISEIQALTAAVERLTGVVEGLVATVEGMRITLASFQGPPTASEEAA